MRKGEANSGSMALYADTTIFVGKVVLPGVYRFVDSGGVRAWGRAALWRVRGTAESGCRRRFVAGHGW
jgi:hypothetical protein